MRSIPQSLKDRIDAQFQTLYNNANPHMGIIVTRARSSVRDPSYFTTETIRTITGAGDVAVSARRLLNYGPPDRIYEIHIDMGVAKTSIREYPDTLKERWKPQFDVAEAMGVSICFDGYWSVNPYKRYGMQTEEKPWIFWINTYGELYAKYWDEGSDVAIATSVSKVDSIRGWIPAQAGHTDDQGLIVAYVKTDGKAYYRNYCLQEDLSHLWEVEREITELGTDCIGIRIFRTNDYRVGFIAEKVSGTTMAITSRNWGGMAIEPDNLTGAVLAPSITIIQITYYDGYLPDEHIIAAIGIPTLFLGYTGVDNAFMRVENVDNGSGDWGSVVTFKLQYDVSNITLSDFRLVDTDGGIYNCLSLTRVDVCEYRATFTDFNNSSMEGTPVTVQCRAISTLNGAGTDMDAFSTTFYPQNLVPVEIPLPEPAVAWNE